MRLERKRLLCFSVGGERELIDNVAVAKKSVDAEEQITIAVTNRLSPAS